MVPYLLFIITVHVFSSYLLYNKFLMTLYTVITFEFLYNITDLYIGCRSLDRVHFYSHSGTLRVGV